VIRVVLLAALLVLRLPAATLDQILDRSAKAAEDEINFLSSITCTESVVEAKLNQKDKIESERKRAFDYFVLVDTSDGDISVNESRIEDDKARKEGKPLVHSLGFALMMLIFHPLYQPSFQFSDAGSQIEAGSQGEDGMVCRRIAFRYVAGKRSPTLLKAGAREYPLSWEGEALVDSRSGKVRRIEAQVVAQLEEIGLKSLQVSVDYGPPKLPGVTDWAPIKAEVDLRTPHQHWHNTHSFAQFKRFSVDTTERVVTKPQ
jgi:hypothetical protein